MSITIIPQIATIAIIIATVKIITILVKIMMIMMVIIIVIISVGVASTLPARIPGRPSYSSVAGGSSRFLIGCKNHCETMLTFYCNRIKVNFFSENTLFNSDLSSSSLFHRSP